MKLFQKLINLLKAYKSTQKKFHLHGKELNLTSDNIQINSNNFSVDKNGNIAAKSGTVGGYSLAENSFSAEIYPLKDYTDDDCQKIVDYLGGVVTLTEQEKILYDVNGDGVINSADIAIIRRLINSNVTTTEHGTIQIQNRDPVNTIVLKDKDGKIVTRIGLTGIYTNKLQVENAETILYENDEGSNEDIELSEEAGLYSYIEIYYKSNDDWNSSVKVYSPDNKKVALNCIYTNGVNLWHKSKGIVISGMSITNNGYIETRQGNGENTTATNSNNIYITRIVGYN